MSPHHFCVAASIIPGLMPACPAQLMADLFLIKNSLPTTTQLVCMQLQMLETKKPAMHVIMSSVSQDDVDRPGSVCS